MKYLRNYLLICILTILGIQCSEVKKSYENIENGIKLETRNINLKVQFYSENMVRILKWDSKGTDNKQSLVVTCDSLPDLEIAVSDNGKTLTLSSEKLTLFVSKADGRIDYLTNNKKLILKEITSEFSPVNYARDDLYHVKQKFKLSATEGIYGLGQHQHGYLNLRNKKVTLVQTNVDAVTPMLVSTGGYGILWDNYSKTVFEDSQDNTSLWSDAADNIDYYFIYGETIDNIIAGYRYLSGDAPMFGKWAYGYWQSKEHYDTRDELLSVARKYRDLQIPIDNIIQDWDYWDGDKNWSQLFFDENKFPNAKEMVDEIHGLNLHLMISVWTGLGWNTPVYKEMDKNGFLYDKVGWATFKYYDAFNPAANTLYWKHLEKGLHSKGIDGWWVDSTEPDIINALTKESTEYEMKRIGRNFMGSWAKYLNAYSLVMTNGLYKNLRQKDSLRRAYILTRSTFAGQQRNAATTWSGDIGASWSIYKKQIAAGLNHCMAGIPYWTFDIGAFVLGSYEGVFSNGGKDPAYQELYTRMFQFGAFCPIFRSHGSETPREIWEFGEFSDILIKYDNLRYRLMPYTYSLAWKVTDQGYTIMRGLAMDNQTDKKAFSVDDQFMFGSSIMACPVTEYMKYRPPESSILIEPGYFKTNDGKPGLHARYFSDPDFKNLTHDTIDANINVDWYSGRPDYTTDSSYSIRWEGKLIPKETGKHRFHIKCFDAKRIYLDGKELPYNYTATEYYTEETELEAGKEYDFKLEIKNRKPGAARTKLFWKTPEIYAKEKIVETKEETRDVYLPANHEWIDFWTGKTTDGGATVTANAPVEIMPLFIKAGSIIPMGPFVQYSTEKPADPIELRIYTGADADFTLYEDENDNYNYEKGLYATIDFHWNDSEKKLVIGKRKGDFPGMITERMFNIVLVSEKHGVGIDIEDNPDKAIQYNGEEQAVQF